MRVWSERRRRAEGSEDGWGGEGCSGGGDGGLEYGGVFGNLGYYWSI